MVSARRRNFLPPNYPSYKKITAYRYDLTKAKSLIKAAGATGQQVTVWGNDSDLASKSMQYVADQLNKIGLKAKIKLVARAIYWQTVGNQATKAQMGWADWFQDYPHPLDWIDTLMNGDRITQIHNNNYGNVDVKAVNAKIAELKKEPVLTAAVNAQWAQLDEDLSRQGRRRGAVPEPGGDRLLRVGHRRGQLLRQQRPVPVGLRRDLQEVAGSARSEGCRAAPLGAALDSPLGSGAGSVPA